MARLIDLHTHTTASDGTLTPTELVRCAVKKGLCAIAITDHDTISGVKEAIEEGNKIGIEVIPGAEISAQFECEMHILGLNVDYKSELLNANLNRLKNDRDERNPKMIAKLKEFGFDITMEEVENESGGEIVGRPHMARVLINKGYVKDIGEAFDKYLAYGKSAYVDKDKLAPNEILNIILQSNGVPILAHPGLMRKSPDKIEEIIITLKNNGLMGIEVYHSDHDEQTTKLLLTLAKRHNLLISGGSDFHGMNKDLDLGEGKGNLRIPYELLEKIKNSR